MGGMGIDFDDASPLYAIAVPTALESDRVGVLRGDLPSVYVLGNMDGLGGSFVPRVIRWTRDTVNLELKIRVGIGKHSHFMLYQWDHTELKWAQDWACVQWHFSRATMDCPHPPASERGCPVDGCSDG